MSSRRPSKHLVSTYVVRRKDGKHDARVVDGRTRREGKCTKADVEEAIACSRQKALS